LAVEKLIRHNDIKPVDEELKFIENKKFSAEILDRRIKGDRIFFAKPLTYMNSSGEAVSKIMEYFNLSIDDLIIIADEVDLPLGWVRFNLSGSSAGQKGIESIIECLGSDQFKRVRIGISGHDKEERGIDTKNYVLSKISDKEMPILNEVIDEAIQYIVDYLGGKSDLRAKTFKAKNLKVI
jgi:PTH1 family peptidyl-tRNA hydrolase